MDMEVDSKKEEKQEGEEIGYSNEMDVSDVHAPISQPDLENRIQGLYDILSDGDEWKGYDRSQKILCILSGHLLMNPGGGNISADIIANFLQKVEPETNLRVTNIEFGIQSTPRIDYGGDLFTLHEAVASLFSWYTDDEIRNKFAAPARPFIQVSGAGKTKLISDYCQHSDIPYERLFICCLKDNGNSGIGVRKVYQHYLSSGDLENEAKFLDAIHQIIKNTRNDKVVLFFDEAQHLVPHNHIDNLRKALRLKRETKEVVAIFAGTQTALANCYPLKAQRLSSRAGETIDTHYQSGERLYEPLYILNTMGCFASKTIVEDSASEFQKAIPFGRPLFARLLFDEDKLTDWKTTRELSDESMSFILTRMLIGRTDPFGEKQNSCASFASLWGTRVQIGSTHSILADTLVSKGYAHLTGFRFPQTGESLQLKPSVSFAYLPDPVCARLAMCMMDEEWSIERPDHVRIKGRHKVEWVQMLGELFSSYLCHPPRGDLGETMSAVFLLLTGDEIRKKADSTFNTFSIGVADWVTKLLNPSSKLVELPDAQNLDGQISFIQFCRNSLRFGVNDYCNQSFLEYLHDSKSAAYTFEGCSLFDALGSIKFSSKYVPLFMSFKTRFGFTTQDGSKEIDSIVKSLHAHGQTCALILVVVLDWEDPVSNDDAPVKENEDDSAADKDDKAVEAGHIKNDAETASSHPGNAKRVSWQSMSKNAKTAEILQCDQKFVARFIKIPSDDPYGISDITRNLTRNWEEADVFASQSYVGTINETDLEGCRENDSGDTDAILTKKNPSERSVASSMLQTMWKARENTRNKPTASSAESSSGRSQVAPSDNGSGPRANTSVVKRAAKEKAKKKAKN